MTENSIDVNIVPVKNGMKRVVVSYYHYSRKEKDRMSSQTATNEFCFINVSFYETIADP